jgi:hypothetical protein
LQQYPSTQLPDVHCVPAVQTLPLATVPHDALTQGSPTQSLLLAQVIAHLALPLAHL